MSTQTINISLPKSLLAQIDSQAKRESRSRSELLREAVRVYLNRMNSWTKIYELGRKTGKKLGIKTENDVDRIVHDFRQGR